MHGGRPPRSDTATGNNLDRDCGFSAALPSSPGQALWTFCDTAIYSPQGTLIGFIGGSTAARGPYSPGLVPTGLSELPTPPAPIGALPNQQAPARFLPVPGGLLAPDGVTACGTAGSNTYAASWISGLTRGPNKVLSTGQNAQNLFYLTYLNVCVNSTSWSVQSSGAAFYDPVANTFVSSATIFTRPSTSADLIWQRQLGSPIFSSDGYLYLFASHCDSAAFGACGAGRTILARTPWQSSSGWFSAGSYRYWTSSGWVSDPNAAQSVASGARPFAVDVHTYANGRLELVEQTTIAGNYRIWTASSPAGPWTAGTESVIPGCESSTTSWCYAFIGHPELSTATTLLMSYYDPDDKHVRVAAVPVP
jgi:hypothetical protein